MHRTRSQVRCACGSLAVSEPAGLQVGAGLNGRDLALTRHGLLTPTSWINFNRTLPREAGADTGLPRHRNSQISQRPSLEPRASSPTRRRANPKERGRTGGVPRLVGFITITGALRDSGAWPAEVSEVVWMRVGAAVARHKCHGD